MNLFEQNGHRATLTLAPAPAVRRRRHASSCRPNTGAGSENRPSSSVPRAAHDRIKADRDAGACVRILHPAPRMPPDRLFHGASAGALYECWQARNSSKLSGVPIPLTLKKSSDCRMRVGPGFNPPSGPKAKSSRRDLGPVHRERPECADRGAELIDQEYVLETRRDCGNCLKIHSARAAPQRSFIYSPRRSALGLNCGLANLVHSSR